MGPSVSRPASDAGAPSDGYHCSNKRSGIRRKSTPHHRPRPPHLPRPLWLGDEDLAAFLQCDAWGLAHLAFIPYPNPQLPDFADQVAAAAAKASCAVEALSAALTNDASGFRLA
jgi:hypothetical protein